MSLTYSSKKRRRVYTRSFDHDLCRRLYTHGVWTQKSLAEFFGVSACMIQQVLNPEYAAATYRATIERQRAHSHNCSECEAPITNGAAANARRRGFDPIKCGKCRQRAAAPTVRPDTLLCCACQQWLPDEDFPHRHDRSAGARRGRHSQCRLCNAVAKRLWRDENADKVAARAVAYRERRNELNRARRAAKRAAS